jgi:hypothetical protein
VHERLRKITPQLALRDVELLGQQAGGPHPARFCSNHDIAPVSRPCLCTANAIKNPQSAKAPSPSRRKAPRACRRHYGFDRSTVGGTRRGRIRKAVSKAASVAFPRNRLVPVPRVGSFAELNRVIDAADQAGLGRVIEGHRAPIGVEFAREASLPGRLPVKAFDNAGELDTARELQPRVDARARVRVSRCRNRPEFRPRDRSQGPVVAGAPDQVDRGLALSGFEC